MSMTMMVPDEDLLARIRRARERFFSDGEIADPDIRPEIAHSWRRSLEYGVDASHRHLPVVDSDGRARRLRRAAGPVLARAADQLAGSSAWLFLLDRNCTQLGPAIGDDDVRRLTERRGAVPGAVFHEMHVGTNGSGTAAERLEPFAVLGPEHYRDAETSIVSVGAPIRDELNRIVGILSFNCHADRANSLVAPFTRDIAWAIGHALAEEARSAQYHLLTEYGRHARRPSQPSFAVGPDLLIANAAARELSAQGLSLERLAERALEAVVEAESSDVEVSVPGADETTIRVRRVELREGEAGAVVQVVNPPSRMRARGGGSVPAREITLLRNARAARMPALVIGERGSGRATLVLDAVGHPSFVCDARSFGRDPQRWLDALEKAARREGATILIRHVDDMAPEHHEWLADLIAGSSAWVVATSGSHVMPGGTGVLEDRFAVVAARSPLRERRDEIPAIVDSILRSLRPHGRPMRCAPHVVAILVKQRWPGNVTQLRRVLATAAMAARDGEITLDDIPPTALVDATAREMTMLERQERELLLTALRDASWNREAASKSLGISRATIYRKIRQFGITVPSSRS